ncbi:MAG: TetR/AcrR family transcriptional regulator [Bryobacteraceae bacterium]
MSTPTKQRLPAELRRAAIIDAAVDLFSSRGFRGTTTRELAAAVGVTEPVLYQHFETKRALYTAILESHLSTGTGAGPDTCHVELLSELESYTTQGDSRAFFTRLAEFLLDWYLRDPRFARMLLFSRLENHELSELFYERTLAVFYGMVVSHIEALMARGSLRKMNPLLAARTFAGMVSHQGLIYCVWRPGELPGGRDEVIRTVVDIFLHGVIGSDTKNETKD